MNTLLHMGISGSLMIVFIMCFRKLAFARVPKRVIVLLWLSALIRLLTPFFISIRWNVMGLANQVLQNPYPGTNTDIGRTIPEFLSPAVKELLPVSGQTALSCIIGRRTASLSGAVTALWLLVALSLAAAIVVNHLICLRRYQEAVPCSNAAAAEWLRSRRSRQRIRLRTSDRISGPLTYGLLRPVILFPAGLKLTDSQLLLILRHEWIHIRRWDILLKYLMYAAVCIYWFNPLIWFMAVLLNRDMELACDEEVVQSCSGILRKTYALLLIQIAQNQLEGRTAGMHFSKRSGAEERIRAIMAVKHYSKKTIIMAASAFLCMVPAFTSMAQPQAGSPMPQNVSSVPDRPAGTAAAPGIPLEDPSIMVTGKQIAELAVHYTGAPYIYGGSDLSAGVDCSGFIKAIYGKAGITLPSEIGKLAREGTAVKAGDIAAGDIVFYGKADDSDSATPVHAAIYIGGGRIIHAKNARDGVIISDIGYRTVSFITRILN